MRTLAALNELFFTAEKIKDGRKFRVLGLPNKMGNKIEYRPQARDFDFCTYKEVVFASAMWANSLLGKILLSDFMINSMEYGHDKQWFNLQLFKRGDTYNIDNEEYFPFINVYYSYDNPNIVRYNLGFYRYRCGNGLLMGMNRISNITIETKSIYDLPTKYNKCLLQDEIEKFEQQIKILKKTEIFESAFKRVFQKIKRRWDIEDDLYNQYTKELGFNAYALLNILTDAATNFDKYNKVDLSENKDYKMKKKYDSQSKMAKRQSQVGQFLEKLIEEINLQNKILHLKDLINKNNFEFSNENITLIKRVLSGVETYYFDPRTSKAFLLIK